MLKYNINIKIVTHYFFLQTYETLAALGRTPLLVTIFVILFFQFYETGCLLFCKNPADVASVLLATGKGSVLISKPFDSFFLIFFFFFLILLRPKEDFGDLINRSLSCAVRLISYCFFILTTAKAVIKT